MKLQVLGVKRIKGTSQKSGNDYDMCSLYALTPMESVKNANMQITGYGHEVAEMPLDPSILENFEKIRFPAMLTLQLEARAYRGKFESFVVGFTQESNVKAAAG